MAQSSNDGEVVLAFDLSVNTVGWAVGKGRTPVTHGLISLGHTDNTNEKLVEFQSHLIRLFEEYLPDEVVVEQPLGSRGHVTARHYELVGVLRAITYQRLGRGPHLIHVSTIKSTMGVRRGTGDHRSNKEVMVDRINELFSLTLGYEDNDAADAYAALITYWHQQDKHNV